MIQPPSPITPYLAAPLFMRDQSTKLVEGYYHYIPDCIVTYSPSPEVLLHECTHRRFIIELDKYVYGNSFHVLRHLAVFSNTMRYWFGSVLHDEPSYRFAGDSRETLHCEPADTATGLLLNDLLARINHLESIYYALWPRLSLLSEILVTDNPDELALLDDSYPYSAVQAGRLLHQIQLPSAQQAIINLSSTIIGLSPQSTPSNPRMTFYDPLQTILTFAPQATANRVSSLVAYRQHIADSATEFLKATFDLCLHDAPSHVLSSYQDTFKMYFAIPSAVSYLVSDALKPKSSLIVPQSVNYMSHMKLSSDLDHSGIYLPNKVFTQSDDDEHQFVYSVDFLRNRYVSDTDSPFRSVSWFDLSSDQHILHLKDLRASLPYSDRALYLSPLYLATILAFEHCRQFFLAGGTKTECPIHGWKVYVNDVPWHHDETCELCAIFPAKSGDH